MVKAKDLMSCGREQALLLGEWVIKARETAFLGDRGVNSAFYGVWKSGMIAGCKNTDTLGTHTASPASGQLQRSRASSVTRRPASSICAGGGKKAMRRGDGSGSGVSCASQPPRTP